MDPNDRDRDTSNVTGSNLASSHRGRQAEQSWTRYAVIAAALIVGAIALMILIRDPAGGPDGAATGAGAGTTSGITSTGSRNTPDATNTSPGATGATGSTGPGGPGSGATGTTGSGTTAPPAKQ